MQTNIIDQANQPLNQLQPYLVQPVVYATQPVVYAFFSSNLEKKIMLFKSLHLVLKNI